MSEFRDYKHLMEKRSIAREEYLSGVFIAEEQSYDVIDEAIVHILENFRLGQAPFHRDHVLVIGKAFIGLKDGQHFRMDASIFLGDQAETAKDIAQLMMKNEVIRSLMLQAFSHFGVLRAGGSK